MNSILNKQAKLDRYIPTNRKYNDDEEINIKNIDTTNKTNFKVDIEKNVDFSIKLKHEILEIGTGPTVVPLLLSLNPKEVQTEVKANIDLVCLLDKSGSMRGEKIQLLKDSFLTIMEYLGDNDRMSLVIFDSSSTRITPLLRMTQENKQTTLEALSSINASGGTSIGSAFYEAMEILKQRRYINSVTSVLVLSDGLDSMAENQVKSHLANYESQVGTTFTINTFGYGSDHDPNMMSALSNLKDGSFNFIDKLDTVDEVFVDCLGGLISVVAQNVKICIEANADDSILPGIRLQHAYGIDGFWKEIKQGQKYEAEILQLISGKKYEYIIDVYIPKLEDINTATRTFLVTNARSLMNDLESKQIIKESECAITFGDESDIPNEYISIQTFRVKSAQLIKLANTLSEKGEYQKAETMLSEYKSEIQKSVYKDLPFVLNLMKDLDNAINNVKPEVYENVGKHYLLENFKANMCQISNKNSANIFSNSRQIDMVEKVKAKKAMKK